MTNKTKVPNESEQNAKTLSGGTEKFPQLPNIVQLADHVRALNTLKSAKSLTLEQHQAGIKLVGLAANLYLMTLERATQTVLQAYQAAAEASGEAQDASNK